MSKGLWAGDAIATGMEMAAMGIRADAAASANLAQAQKMAKTIDILRDANAGNLAEKHALRVALRKLDPKHPLLDNTMLQEKIKDAGRRVLAISDSWDDVRAAGENYKL
jgi:hypothetical protein